MSLNCLKIVNIIALSTVGVESEQMIFSFSNQLWKWVKVSNHTKKIHDIFVELDNVPCQQNSKLQNRKYEKDKILFSLDINFRFVENPKYKGFALSIQFYSLTLKIEGLNLKQTELPLVLYSVWFSSFVMYISSVASATTRWSNSSARSLFSTKRSVL